VEENIENIGKYMRSKEKSDRETESEEEREREG
jgi:hypothetical protein